MNADARSTLVSSKRVNSDSFFFRRGFRLVVILLLSLMISGCASKAIKGLRSDIASLWKELGAQSDLNNSQDIRLSRLEKNLIQLVMADTMMFRTGSARLTTEAYRTLGKISSILKDYPELKLTVAGHTDSVGQAKFNQILSEKRAKRVAEVLIESGIKSEYIKTVGRGQTEPIATNATAAGRAQNRRVTIDIWSDSESA